VIFTSRWQPIEKANGCKRAPVRFFIIGELYSQKEFGLIVASNSVAAGAGNDMPGSA